MSSKSNQKLCFTYEEDDKLVDVISSHPAIYDIRHPLYKDQRAKDSIWVGMSEEVGRSVTDCKKRWRNIKDTYDRRERENIKTDPEASLCKKAKKWKLQEKLSFLHFADVKRKSFYSINEDYDNSVHDEQDDSFGLNPPKLEEESLEAATVLVSAQPLSPQEVSNKEVLTKNKTDQPKKMDFRDRICFAVDRRSKQRDSVVKNRADEETDITLFFKSIAKSVEKLPPYLQQRAKLETLTVISNIESEMWASRQETSAGNQMFTISSPSGCDVSSCDHYTVDGDKYYYK